MEWRPIPGFPGYDVSDQGEVRSWRPQNGRGPAPAMPRMISPTRRSDGYDVVGLGDKRGQQRAKSVHRLVLLIFVGPCPPGQETRHLNGVRHDNRLANLCWGTRLEQQEDKLAHGTVPRGERCISAKLTEIKVREIRASVGITHQGLADQYGVSRMAISKVLSGTTWGHVV